MVSAEGGVEIEEVAEDAREDSQGVHHPGIGLQPVPGPQLAFALGLRATS
jgi:succinyl-CoA synthetase beta subunit